MAPTKRSLGSQHETGEGFTVSISNLGGIDQAEVTFEPGVTVLAGQNATNRTSLLRAINGALGGSYCTLKTDSDQGEVDLQIGTSTYTRSYVRDGQRTRVSGDPLTDDGRIVDLFVSLLENNELRTAVRSGDDLRDLLMEPIDTEEIDRQIREAKRRREEYESRLNEIEELEAKLPNLREREESLTDDLDEVEQEIESVNEEIDQHERSRSEVSRAEELSEELSDKRQELNQVQSRLQRTRDEVDRLRSEKEEVAEELEEVEQIDGDESELESQIRDLKESRRQIDDRLASLTSVIGFNETIVQGEMELPGLTEGSTEDPLSQLDPSSETIQCWTCGSAVQREEIGEQLDVLRDLVASQRSERSDIEAEVEELEAKLRELRSTREKRASLQRRREDLEQTIDNREADIESYEEQVAELEAEVEELREEIEEADLGEDDELGQLYADLNDLEFERGRLQQQVENVRAEIREAEQKTDNRDEVEETLADVSSEIENLRQRIEQLETSLVDRFNEHMETLIEALEYRNIARVWLERQKGSSRQNSEFVLHIVRESADGTVYEDTIETLSESERDVVGLVTALTGYLVHDVDQGVPFLLLDSIESLDAGRIETLLDYFSDYTSYLIVALLPEDEQAVSDEYRRITADKLGGRPMST
jgi:DNA repair exonuclease SbcCD ATPase subunit